MTRRHGPGPFVAGCAAVLLVLATLGAPPAASASASASQARVGKLEHHRVLQQLGIPRRSAMRLAPVFRTGFERDADLAGFYVTPQSPMTRHAVQQGGAHRGQRAHVGWLTGQTGPEPVDGPNHRGYPTIQLQKRAAGACIAPIADARRRPQRRHRRVPRQPVMRRPCARNAGQTTPWAKRRP